MNFRKLNHIITPALFCTLFAGCSDSTPLPVMSDEEERGEISIVLRIPMADTALPSRSNPTGGEDGNGREQGLENENEVTDANIFFFKGDSLNPDSPNTIGVAGVYVNNLASFICEPEANPFEKKVTVKVKTSETDLEEKEILTAGEVSFITVLNAGEDMTKKFSTLKELREYCGFSASFQKTTTGYESFVMTTAYDANDAGKISIGGTYRNVGSNRLRKNPVETSENQWIGETTVQRLCARIDLMYKSANEKDGKLVYNVIGTGSTLSGNKVHVTNILPVNVSIKPSYLLTKVTETLPEIWTESGEGNFTWGGVEKTVAGTDKPANYIIDPYTLAKASDLETYSDWFGTTSASTVKNIISDKSEGIVRDYFASDIPATENQGYNRTLVIGYANENILLPSCYTSNYVTGLTFRAVYQPKVILKRTGEDFEPVIRSDAEWGALSDADKTFWRYQPSFITDEDMNADHFSINDSKALYFSSEEDAEAYKEAHKEDGAIITKYENGVCYYNLWLRHYNDSDAEQGEDYPMEYAIVRNNIYRVSINFSGPGDPTPVMREPDTMMSRIFVRKWNLRFEENPLEF